MRRSCTIGMTLLALLAIDQSGLAASPHEKTVIADATYLMADTDTLAGAEENAIMRAKRKAVEEVGIYVEAISEDIEQESGGKTTRTNTLSVRTIAASVTRTDVLETRRRLEQDRLSFYVKVRVTVSMDRLEEAVRRQRAYDELAEHDRLLSSENNKLKAEIDELRSHTRIARRVSPLSESILPNHPIEIVGDYRYFYHDPMTATEAMALAYREALRMAIDTAPPFIDATAFITDHAFRRSLIHIIASEYVKDVTLLEQTEKNRTVYAKIRATLNPQDVKAVVEREVGRSTEKELRILGQPRP